MHYYIDGYNLLFRFISQKNSFSEERDRLIRDLDLQVSLLGLRVTLVFDAHYQEGDFAKTHFRSLEILYTAFGESADALILSEIRDLPKPHRVTVVTSDKKLAWFARRCDVKTESVEHFRAWLNRRYYNKMARERQERFGLVKGREKPVVVVEEAVSEVVQLTVEAPAFGASVEACYDYYHYHFEKEAQVLLEQRKKEVVSQKRQGKPKNGEPSVKSGERWVSDMERWLKAFER